MSIQTNIPEWQRKAADAAKAEQAAMAKADAVDRRLIAPLLGDDENSWRTALTASGIAGMLLATYGSQYLVALDYDDDGHKADVYRARKGGTWSADVGLIAADIEHIGKLWLDALHRIRLRIDDSDKAGKALRRELKARAAEWHKYWRSMTSPKAIASVIPYFDLARHTVSRGMAGESCYKSELPLEWIGAPNGIINLQTGRHIQDAAEARRHHVVGRLPQAYAHDIQSPLAERLLAHLEPMTRHYLLQSLAFALRGNPSRTFLLLLGPGGGGKSVFSNAVMAALGDYAGAVDEDAFSRKRGNAQGLSPSIEALIRPRRLAFMPEASAAAFNAERLKALSGADTIHWRGLYQPMRSSIITATVVLSANDMPNLDGSDAALVDRMRVLPYPSIPAPDRDANILRDFRADPIARAALVSMIVQAGMHLKAPPKPPQAVQDATNAAHSELIGDAGNWALEHIKRQSGAFLSSTRLWESLCQALGKDAGDKVVGGLSRRQLSKLISGKYGRTSKNRDSVSGKTGNGWKGLILTV